MKQFKPNPIMDVPRWLETIIQCILGALLTLYLYFIRLDIALNEKDFFSFAGSKYVLLLILILLMLFIKILGTYTAVDIVLIDDENKRIKFQYWLFYILRKELIINFEELSYKNSKLQFVHGGSIFLLIYQNNKLKIKLDSRNGWKDNQIDEITAEFLKIKPPLRKLIERPF